MGSSLVEGETISRVGGMDGPLGEAELIAGAGAMGSFIGEGESISRVETIGRPLDGAESML